GQHLRRLACGGLCLTTPGSKPSHFVLLAIAAMAEAAAVRTRASSQRNANRNAGRAALAGAPTPARKPMGQSLFSRPRGSFKGERRAYTASSVKPSFHKPYAAYGRIVKWPES